MKKLVFFTAPISLCVSLFLTSAAMAAEEAPQNKRHGHHVGAFGLVSGLFHAARIRHG